MSSRSEENSASWRADSKRAHQIGRGSGNIPVGRVGLARRIDALGWIVDPETETPKKYLWGAFRIWCCY